MNFTKSFLAGVRGDTSFQNSGRGRLLQPPTNTSAVSSSKLHTLVPAALSLAVAAYVPAMPFTHVDTGTTAQCRASTSVQQPRALVPPYRFMHTGHHCSMHAYCHNPAVCHALVSFKHREVHQIGVSRPQKHKHTSSYTAHLQASSSNSTRTPNPDLSAVDMHVSCHTSIISCALHVL
jgi:hypothetical protein